MHYSQVTDVSRSEELGNLAGVRNNGCIVRVPQPGGHFAVIEQKQLMPAGSKGIRKRKQRQT
jgi:hypothetical protein